MESDPIAAIYALTVAVVANLARDLLKRPHPCATREEIRQEIDQALRLRDERYATDEIRAFIRREMEGRAAK